MAERRSVSGCSTELESLPLWFYNPLTFNDPSGMYEDLGSIVDVVYSSSGGGDKGGGDKGGDKGHGKVVKTENGVVTHADGYSHKIGDKHDAKRGDDAGEGEKFNGAKSISGTNIGSGKSGGTGTQGGQTEQGQLGRDLSTPFNNSPGIGTQVMKPYESGWGYAKDILVGPRVYAVDNGFGGYNRYNVDGDGKIFGAAPLGGIAPIPSFSSVSFANLGKSVINGLKNLTFRTVAKGVSVIGPRSNYREFAKKLVPIILM